MTLALALLLALIQGLTEFLPVSSSGHLKLFESWFGLGEPQTLFDVLLHFGTLGATLVFYRVEVGRIFTGLYRVAARKTRLSDDTYARLGLLVALGTLPTGIIGAVLGPRFEESATIVTVGTLLLVNGGLLMLSRGRGASLGARGPGGLRVSDALILGTVQGLAVLRGISRSGSTITAALLLGVNREAAAAFSFLLSIPAILGALVLKSRDLGHLDTTAAVIYAAATLVSAIVGYLALMGLTHIVKRGQLHRFAWYCWALGAGALVWALTSA